MTQSRPKVCQYGVHDPSYPRNSRVRSWFEEQYGAEVVVVPRARRGGRLRRAVSDLTRFWRGSRGASIVVLSEFRLTHAPLAWLVARLRRATLVVDHFVGLHETVVGDWGARADSMRARVLDVQDRLAVRLADVCVTDTTYRAERLGARHGRTVIALPVGAPVWAVPLLRSDSDLGSTPGGLRLLYYGSYLPLHGLDRVVAALGALDVPWSATFIGGGDGRDRIEALAQRAGIAERIEFGGTVPESDLRTQIAAADVVLGAFGPSAKATSVVPNKVWQGLACDRVVVTQDGPGARELRAVVGADRLVLVDPTDPSAFASALRALDPAGTKLVTDSGAALASFVAHAYGRFGQALDRSRRR